MSGSFRPKEIRIIHTSFKGLKGIKNFGYSPVTAANISDEIAIKSGSALQYRPRISGIKRIWADAMTPEFEEHLRSE